MLTLPRSVRVFVCREPCDMRRSFDGLSRMVEAVVGGDPFSGHLFVFRNRRGDRLKVLFWDGDGFAIYYKRLESGVFVLPDPVRGEPAIRASDLAMLLDGVDVSSVRRYPRYSRRA